MALLVPPCLHVLAAAGGLDPGDVLAVRKCERNAHISMHNLLPPLPASAAAKGDSMQCYAVSNIRHTQHKVGVMFVDASLAPLCFKSQG
jgi:hypothetical protein